jgi:4-amino-4-deoxy-L-arabinose transferase-like glycosyltransferase
MRGGVGEQSTNSALVSLLKATNTRWAAATVGAQSAATLELSSGTAVMAIGGFTGSDPAPTLAQFQAYVAQGKVRYFVAGGGMGGGPGGGNSEISSWVAAHYTSTTVGGQTVYDLTKKTS